jgi:hypothetical protein
MVPIAIVVNTDLMHATEREFASGASPVFTAYGSSMTIPFSEITP